MARLDVFQAYVMFSTSTRIIVACMVLLVVCCAGAPEARISADRDRLAVAPRAGWHMHAVIAVTPRYARPLQRLTIAGRGFGHGELLAFYWDGTRRWPRRDHANAAGAFTGAFILVAAQVRSGSHILMVRGLTTGRRAQTLVIVRAAAAPPSPPTAVPSPLPTGIVTPSPRGSATPPSSAHAIKTVFLIVLENQDWSRIKGNPSAPYINKSLLPTASYAQHYYNPPGLHPSLPNYLWLEAGTNFGIKDDKDPAVNHQKTHQHLKSYQGGLYLPSRADPAGLTVASL